ncbi:MAG: hypothetical protein JNK88_11680 [Mangrovicoccus sp.]|nr:hypothetical protein [Mangrovicoccus sp.]
MKTFILTAAIALAAAPVLASDQLARNLGVTPGAYSLTELARLKAAKDNIGPGESDRMAALMAMFGSDTVSSQSAGITSGHAQLAANAGVDPQDYSLAEIVMLRAAVRDGDEARIRFLQRGSAAAMSTQSAGIAPGHRQLAANAGIDPAMYSVQETARIWVETHTDDND